MVRIKCETIVKGCCWNALQNMYESEMLIVAVAGLFQYSKVAYGIDHLRWLCECTWCGLVHHSPLNEWAACFFLNICLVWFHGAWTVIFFFTKNPFNFVAISNIAICYLCNNLFRQFIICLECGGVQHTPFSIFNPHTDLFNFISSFVLAQTQPNMEFRTLKLAKRRYIQLYKILHFSFVIQFFFSSES